jgi:hypothetical protein
MSERFSVEGEVAIITGEEPGSGAAPRSCSLS